ncbi:hypothetical protein QUF54_07185 [Candidatus Marithioploca araucensis]|uniref:Uncharacterized protein n=1 Tax=Candidatus Marithioploca araucensis TaxID=70273 RepID=A0ABT7VU52_9GAMM|nr:hypothetical protein [Candidatus Marithioploca araucensis]
MVLSPLREIDTDDNDSSKQCRHPLRLPAPSVEEQPKDSVTQLKAFYV